MIHYHGSPLGGHADDAVRFFAGRHAFVSVEYPQQVGVVASVCQSFALDNGAFSVWRRGGTLNLDAVYGFYGDWLKHPACDWAIIPDVIQGSEDDNDSLLKAWPFSRTQGVPVWHYHESLERLDRLVSEWPRVALGSSGEWPTPGTSSWWSRTNEAMIVACDEAGYPKCKLHGLRMLSPKLVKRLPLASADSTNAVRNARDGTMRWESGVKPLRQSTRAIVIAESIESSLTACRWKAKRIVRQLSLVNQ